MNHSNPSGNAPAVSMEHQKLALDYLEERHAQILARAISNVLSSNIAELTYAQIIDGIPISDVEKDTYRGTILDEHAIHTCHKDLCPGILEKTRGFRDVFDANSLRFASPLILAYQAAAPGSRAFNTRLVEMVAVAVHQIAAQLYKLHADASPHRSDGLATWTPPKQKERWWLMHPNGAPPTLFRHAWYLDYDQYPEGVADGVGYWAEARILGGVVLFDRRPKGSDDTVDPTAIYFHSDRKDVTYRIYKLTDSQKLKLLEFFLSKETPPASDPLPILGDRGNRDRVDPEESIDQTGIYRDIWERKPLAEDAWDRRSKDVLDSLDWLSIVDFTDSQRRASERRLWLEYGRYEEEEELDDGNK